jgi:hypothetical protein
VAHTSRPHPAVDRFRRQEHSGSHAPAMEAWWSISRSSVV